MNLRILIVLTLFFSQPLWAKTWDQTPSDSKSLQPAYYDATTGYTKSPEPRPRRLPLRKLYIKAGQSPFKLSGAPAIDTISDIKTRIAELNDPNRPFFQATPSALDAFSRNVLSKIPELKHLVQVGGPTQLSHAEVRTLGRTQKVCYSQQVKVEGTYIKIADSKLCLVYFEGNLRQLNVSGFYTDNTFAGTINTPYNSNHTKTRVRDFSFARSLHELIPARELLEFAAKKQIDVSAAISSSNLTLRASSNPHQLEKLIFVPEKGTPEVGYRTTATFTADVSHLKLPTTRLLKQSYRIDFDANLNPIIIQEHGAHAGRTLATTLQPTTPPTVQTLTGPTITSVAVGPIIQWGPIFPHPYPFTETVMVEAYSPNPTTTPTGGPFGTGLFHLPVYNIDERPIPTRLFTKQVTVNGDLDPLPGEGPSIPTSSTGGIDNFFYVTEPQTTFGHFRANEAQSAFYAQRFVRHWKKILSSVGGNPLPGQFYLKGLDLFFADSFFSPTGPDTGGPEVHMSAAVFQTHGQAASIIRHEICHYYAFAVGMTNFTYSTQTQWAAFNEGFADICATVGDHYETGIWGLGNNSRDAESFRTMTNYTPSSDHKSGQIISIAYRNMVRILGDYIPYVTMMSAMTLLQDGDLFLDVRNAWMAAAANLWGASGIMVQTVISKAFSLQEISGPYPNWSCAIQTALPLPDGIDQTISFTHSGPGTLIFNPYSAMHEDDFLYIDDNGATAQGASPVTGHFWDEVTNQDVSQASPFQGRAPQLGTFPFNDDLRIQVTSTTNDKKISHGICADVYPAPTGSSQNPVAVLTADKTIGKDPLLITFDTAASFDPDGGNIVAKYLFFDNNPNPVALDLHVGQTTVSQTFSAKDFVVIQNPTPIQATLVVYDDEGQTDSASVQFTVNPY